MCVSVCIRGCVCVFEACVLRCSREKHKVSSLVYLARSSLTAQCMDPQGAGRVRQTRPNPRVAEPQDEVALL